jgi:hypothetical protein
MENKKLQALLGALAEQPTDAAPEVDNLDLEVARRLTGGGVDDTIPPVYCDIGCALTVVGE